MSKKSQHLVLLFVAVLCMTGTTIVRAEPPSILSVRANSAAVGLYEKLELSVDLEATYTNPFDPNEIDLRAEFTSPSGRKWNVWGFYNPSGWSSLWMVRFSPIERGTWRYVVTVTDCEGTASSRTGSFAATESEHHGFLGIAPNRRYLRYSDGTSFYGVGLWYNDSYELFGRGRITEEGLDGLKNRGAN